MTTAVKLPGLRIGDGARPPVLDLVSSWLDVPADELDQAVERDVRQATIEAVQELNEHSRQGDPDAFYQQQLLLSRIYALSMRLPEKVTAEGSTVLHEVTRLLEVATVAAEDRHLDSGLLAQAPAEPGAFLSWLKHLAREHRSFKHPYYTEFIMNSATSDDLRAYVIQESVVDGRFDDLLAMMQVGTAGEPKMEIAQNFWDEMGNGDHARVHTHLFNQIFEVFHISAAELERALTAEALLSGNLVVLLCRYRRLFPEAAGFLGMTEWLAPDRFVHVVHAWERLGLAEVGIAYHRLHITIDSQHAAGWFHNVVIPAAESSFMRRGIARGALWRLNSSARYLDERLGGAGGRA